MKHLLLIDDVATNLICAVEVLKGQYTISTAKSGRQALLMLNEMTPDLIMLDVNMPQMNGYEVYEKIKENPEWANIPVVFLTAETNPDNEIKGLEMGALDFIRKPFDPVVLKTRIDKILNIIEDKKTPVNSEYVDSLTGLNTKKAFDKFLSSGTKGESGYFLLINLDNFKAVNDIFGHMVGDTVLIKLSEVFLDIAKDSNRVCRLGGDVFALLLPSELSKDEVKIQIRKLIASCEYEISEILSGYSEFKKVSVSVGVAIKPEDGCDFQSLYINADKALYFVKQNGKRGYHFYDTVKYAPEEFEEENTCINLMQLQRLISENDERGGAYTVEYEGFKRIYRFVSRCMDRKGEDVQIVLFTINSRETNKLERENKFVRFLRESISSSLRRGDVATQCGNSQYVVILMGTGVEGGKKVIERIGKRFDEHNDDDDISLSYEIETVMNRENA